MANHVADSLRYYLSIENDHLDDLACIRHWSSLKVGYEENLLWVKDFTYGQIMSIDVRSIPFKTVYYEQNGKLVLLNHLLNSRTVPSTLWTPIDRALSVKLPSMNHNFFGIEENVHMRLIAADTEQEGVAMITSMTLLQRYVDTSPVFRLQNLRWCALNDNDVLIFGKPFLPLPGEVFWTRKDFLLPAGFDFEFHLLTDVLHAKINASREHWVLWNSDGTYSRIPKTKLVALSRSSLRLTLDAINTLKP